MTSSVFDGDAQFSPDGRRVAFCSSRSGFSLEVWTTAADGSGAQQLTHGPGGSQCSPHWSPDDHWIAFDSKGDDGRWHIWTIDADGGVPQQVTQGSGNQYVSTWSHDGIWIYFLWDQGDGVRDIWRARVLTRQEERVTKVGTSTSIAFESLNGKSILHQPKGPDSPLVAASLLGGGASQIIPALPALHSRRALSVFTMSRVVPALIPNCM